jgi:hypothetical protein
MTSRRVAILTAVAVLVGAVVTTADAQVTRTEILQRESPLAVDRTPGATGVAGVAGQRERISGKVHGELDPNDPKNAIITDIRLAPRNAKGRVEYVATFSLVKPIDMTKASGLLVYSVVNRGGGTATPSSEGHVSVVSGWQGDLVPTTGNQTILVPVASNPDGSSITGPFVLRFTNQTGDTAKLMIPRGQPSPYPPATLDTTKASLVSATAESATGVKSGVTVIRSADWAFADCAAKGFPGTPDPTKVCLKNGFNPALLYELQYTVKNPLVLGIGLAATRDLNSFLRYETQDAFGTPNPVAGHIRWAIAEGSSQSGTFLKLSILLGFNQDLAGRVVFDGSNPNIAARVTDLNRRFALPGGLVMLYELGHEAPVWWEDWEDTARGRGTAGLLDRCRQSRTCPKILETFGASEVGTATVLRHGGHHREGRPSVAGQRPPLLLPRRQPRWRFGRLQRDDAGSQRMRARQQPGAHRADAVGAAAIVHRMGDDRNGDAGEHVPTNLGWHARAVDTQRHGLPEHSRPTIAGGRDPSTPRL